MSQTIKLENITPKNISDNGVQALSNRPNVSAQYGVSGLSPTKLKEWFDNLASLLAKKINELQDAISSNDAAKYIRLCLDNYDVSNLNDLVESFEDGTFAEKILKVYPSVDEEVKSTLQAVLNDTAKNISDLWENSVTSGNLSITNNNKLVLELKNKAGVKRTDVSIDATVRTGRIANYAVTEDKIDISAVTTTRIKDNAVTTAKISNNAVTTEKINDLAVSSRKISELAVTEPKLAYASVSERKIRDEAVTTEKIASGAVTSNKLASGAVTSGKIGFKAVTKYKIDDAAVIGTNISAGSISEDKLTSDLSNRLKTLEYEAFTSVSYNPDNGILTFKSVGGTTEKIDLPLELIVKTGSYDDTAGQESIVLVLANGDEIRIPVTDLLSELIGYVDGIRKRIYGLQEAPPLAALSDAILLCTPTLGQLAALGNYPIYNLNDPSLV